jgi:hypothetical protein
MSASILTDELIGALAAMQQAMTEFESERNNFELSTGKEPDAELILEALIAAGSALLAQNEMVAAPQFNDAMMSARDAAWFAEAALRRACARLVAYRAG